MRGLHLGRHKLRRSYKGGSNAFLVLRDESEVANLHRAARPINEDVVALGHIKEYDSPREDLL